MAGPGFCDSRHIASLDPPIDGVSTYTAVVFFFGILKKTPVLERSGCYLAKWNNISPT